MPNLFLSYVIWNVKDSDEIEINEHTTDGLQCVIIIQVKVTELVVTENVAGLSESRRD